MVLGLGKKTLETAVVLLALYAALLVPLGERTLWQHAVAIWRTPEAQRASRELKQAGGRMLLELSDFEARPMRGSPRLPPLKAPQRTANNNDSAANDAEP
jgi:hypothetical protein